MALAETFALPFQPSQITNTPNPAFIVFFFSKLTASGGLVEACRRTVPDTSSLRLFEAM
uniref:Uncharacterized protein n=1 Tax=Oryza sativa subsp. japonica TaxID=39947 RepID=Q6Z7I1_ORYSJ|nr:hypothetical protein [Oryza sativa Japonica Group]